MKKVLVIRNIGTEWEEEIIFSADVMPMAKHFADMWAKRNGYKLIKSPRKQAELFNPCRVAVDKNECIFYVA